MFRLIFPMLMLFALPAFLIGPVLSLVLPALSGWFTGWLGEIFKRASSWETSVSPLVGGALHLVMAAVITGVMIHLGVDISTGTVSCLNDPNGHASFSCIDQVTQAHLVQYVLTLITQYISHNASAAHQEFKHGTGRYAGIRPRR